MYNLQIYSSALLVLAFYIKSLTGLPVEVQPVHPGPPQPNPPPIDIRSLNVSESNPSSRSLDAQAANASVEAAAPALRSLPSNPVNPPQLEDVAARNGLGLENQQTISGAAPADGSVSQNPLQPRIDSAQSNLNVSQEGAPAVRSGREDLTPNVTNVEARSLNVDGPSPAATPHLTNNTAVEARNVDSNSPPQAANASSGIPFIPSFLKSFGLRQKRGEDSLGADVAEQASSTNDSPVIVVAERNSNDEPSPVGYGDVVSQLNSKVASNDANVQSSLESVSLDPAASSSVNVPYINVYPVDNLEI